LPQPALGRAVLALRRVVALGANAWPESAFAPARTGARPILPRSVRHRRTANLNLFVCVSGLCGTGTLAGAVKSLKNGADETTNIHAVFPR